MELRPCNTDGQFFNSSKLGIPNANIREQGVVTVPGLYSVAGTQPVTHKVADLAGS